jgi:hypothetical protein
MLTDHHRNLQCANHVIFVSALVVESQSRYKAIMKQAIGRCDRAGQTKPVHVYHFLMAKTVEVNIWQARENKKVFGENGVFLGIKPDGKLGEWEGPGLQGAACGAGGVNVLHGDDEDEEEDDGEEEDEDDEDEEDEDEDDEE